jgi:hypothetical protein
MGRNAFTTWLGCCNPWALEDELIRRLCLPLNVDQNLSHPVSPVPTALRRAVKVRWRGLEGYSPESDVRQAVISGFRMYRG